MALEDGLKSIKQELSSDEKLLEQAFHLEKFFKKNKKAIIATVVLLIGAFIGYKVYDYVQTSKLEAANSALLALQKNPNNKEALSKLKSNNEKLYNLYIYSVAANGADIKQLSNLNVNDEFLKDVIAYHKGIISKKPTDSIYYKNLSIVEKAYILIKQGKKKEAKDLLETVSQNSALAGVVRLLKHYTIN